VTASVREREENRGVYNTGGVYFRINGMDGDVRTWKGMILNYPRFWKGRIAESNT
jgi:hypothetical protein